MVIFMAENQHESLDVEDNETSQLDLTVYEVKILHHNVQNINNS